MTRRQPRRRGPDFQSIHRNNAELGFRTLPIAEYEAQHGSVGQFQHVEGGIVEFVIERPGYVRFLRVTKDGKPYNALRSGHESE